MKIKKSILKQPAVSPKEIVDITDDGDSVEPPKKKQKNLTWIEGAEKGKNVASAPVRKSLLFSQPIARQSKIPEMMSSLSACE